jgi:hypothetical protein
MNFRSNILRELGFVFLCFAFSSFAINTKNLIDVNLRKGLIGPISVTDNPEVIKAKLGAANVKPYTGESEGQGYHGYKLTFSNGQIVDANWAYLEINSAGFRTSEGLGIGSTWKAFRAAYSDGEFSWMDDAGAIWSEKYKFRLYFRGNAKPNLDDRVTVIHLTRDGAKPW